MFKLTRKNGTKSLMDGIDKATAEALTQAALKVKELARIAVGRQYVKKKQPSKRRERKQPENETTT